MVGKAIVPERNHAEEFLITHISNTSIAIVRIVEGAYRAADIGVVPALNRIYPVDAAFSIKFIHGIILSKKERPGSARSEVGLSASSGEEMVQAQCDVTDTAQGDKALQLRLISVEVDCGNADDESSKEHDTDNTKHSIKNLPNH